MEFPRKCYTQKKQAKTISRFGNNLNSLKQGYPAIIQRKLNFDELRKQMTYNYNSEAVKQKQQPLANQHRKAPNFYAREDIYNKEITQKNILNATWLKQISSLQIMAVVLVLLLIISGLAFWVTSSCMQKYQEKQCWKEELMKTSECIKFQECIKQEEEADYYQYFITFAATFLFICKKYWRQMIKFACNMKENSQSKNKTGLS